MSTMLPTRYDTIIVGARCAGAATALHLARAGQRVLVVDRDQPKRDALSTHALMRLGVSLLDEAGVLPSIMRAGTPPVRRTVFNYGGVRFPVEVAPRGRAAGLYAPRRFVLDTALIDAARAAGAEVLFGTAFEGLIQRTDGRVTGVILRAADGTLRKVTCTTVVGADGRMSRVAEAAGAMTLRTSTHRSACVYTYVAAPKADAYEWLYGTGAIAGLIPTNDGRACAFAAVRPEDLNRLFRDAPYKALRRVFHHCGADQGALPLAPSERLRRFAGAPGHMRQAWGPGWALVGDAGYFKDPATAHGLTDALRDAKLLASALLAGTDHALLRYQSTRDALSVDFFEVTDRIASFDWTLEEVQALHMELHRLMRIEHEAILPRPQAQAA